MKRRLQYTPSTTANKLQQSPSQFQGLNFESARKILFDTDLMTSSDRRKQSSFGSRVSGMKQALDSIISTVSAKKSVQRGAIQRVHEVNMQLKQQLSHEQNLRGTKTYNSILEQKCFDDDTTYIDHHKSRQSLTSIQEQPSVRLKKALNQKIKDNNQLMVRLKNLQNQHEYLRDQSLYSYNSCQQYQIEENRRLKDELARLNNQHTVGYTVYDLWQEFCQLKEENDKLRQQTILLLKINNPTPKNSKLNEYESHFPY